MLKIKVFVCLILLSLLIYANVINGEFILDDYPLIVHNQYIKNFKSIPLLFGSNLWQFTFEYPQTYSYYRPLPSLSYLVDYSIYKLNSRGFHLTSIIIHALNSFLVFCLLYRLFKEYRFALLSSILFCVHPIHTETVSLISCRAELMVAAFIMLSLIFYLDYLTTRRNIKYFISIFSFICALLSRETGVFIFLPVFIFIAGLKSGFSRKQVLLHSFSFFGITAVYLVLRLTILVPIEYLPYNALPLVLEFLNFFYLVGKYIQLLIFPYQLHVFRSVGAITTFWSFGFLKAIFVLIALIISVVVSLKQKRYIILFGLTWFILSLLSLLRFMYKFRDILALEEHWGYLASAGFFIIFAYLLLNIPNKKPSRVLTFSIISIFCGLTVFNNLHFKNY